MLPLASNVPLVLNFESLHGAPHVQVRHRLDRIPYPHIGDLNLRLIRGSDFGGYRNQMDDVKLVTNKFVYDEGTILRMMKIEDNGISPANWLAQFKNEESGRVRLGVGHCEIATGNINSCDGLLFSGIRILDQHGPLNRDCLLFLPADQRHSAGSQQDGDQQSAPGFNLVSTSHAEIS